MANWRDWLTSAAVPAAVVVLAMIHLLKAEIPDGIIPARTGEKKD
jgi:hypothetical protein